MSKHIQREKGRRVTCQPSQNQTPSTNKTEAKKGAIVIPFVRPLTDKEIREMNLNF